MAHHVTVTLLIDDPCSPDEMAAKISKQLDSDDIINSKQFVDCRVAVSPVPDFLEDAIGNDTYTTGDFSEPLVMRHLHEPTLFWNAGEWVIGLENAERFKAWDEKLYAENIPDRNHGQLFPLCELTEPTTC